MSRSHNRTFKNSRPCVGGGGGLTVTGGGLTTTGGGIIVTGGGLTGGGNEIGFGCGVRNITGGGLIGGALAGGGLTGGGLIGKLTVPLVPSRSGTSTQVPAVSGPQIHCGQIQHPSKASSA